MKKLVAAIVVGFLLGPVLAVPAQAGGGWHGGHRHGGCCWGGFGVSFTCLRMMAIEVSPSKTRRPVTKW